jgi:phage/plasmid-like protein (TIGR03299 family)
MAHDLNFSGGKAAMMSVGEMPWHGLGQILEEPPTAQDAIRLSGLDWKVVKKPIFAMEGSTYYGIPKRFALVREDLWGQENCPIFAMVADTYEPLQNTEAFSFFDDLVCRKAATYETAGALGQGERVWVMAKLKKEIVIAGRDKLDPFILLANGHNAATAIRIMLTPVRVVCQNTLNYAFRTSNNEFRVHHGRGMHKKLDNVREQLDCILAQYEALADRFEVMAKRQMTGTDLMAYLECVFPTPDPDRLSERSYEKAVAEVESRRAATMRLFEEGQGNSEPVIRGSLWAAYNGVTEWADHRMPFSSRFQRFNSLFFGEASRVKSRALSQALYLIGDNEEAENIILWN